MDRNFVTLDVFTEEALTGNPLAVVLDSEGLDGAAMQSVAREFNLSETVFVLPAENATHRARLRIFTPEREVPFAGHPTVGAAVLLGTLDWGEGDEQSGIVTLEEEIGLVRVGLRLKSGQAGFAEFDVPQLPRNGDNTPGRSDIAAATGLFPSDIGFDNHVPSVMSAGLPFVFVPVRDTEALGRARPVRALWKQAFGKSTSGAVYLYTRPETKSPSTFRARMFAPLMGVEEDPATGSAAAAFSGVVARFESLGDGDHVITLLQGVEMGRPSRMRLEVEIGGGSLRGARVGGSAVIVSRGVLYL